MNKDTLVILASTIMVPIIAYLFGKKKNDADSHNVVIGGQIDVGDFGLKYAEQVRRDMSDMRAEFVERIDSLVGDHDREINILKAEFERITAAKDQRITTLEAQVAELQTEVAKYKNVGEHIADSIHIKVNEVKNEIKEELSK